MASNIRYNPVLSILLEFRRLVRSSNVFVQLSRKCRNVNVVLLQNSLEMTIDGSLYRIPITSNNIMVDSLTSLQKWENYISFRFCVTSTDYLGSFKAEVLNAEGVASYWTNNQTVLKKNEKYTFKCGNCNNVFCTDVKFRRVLPLPSDSGNIQAWFCHADANKAEPNLSPKEDDFFYSKCFAHVYQRLLHEVDVIQNCVRCKNCKESIGNMVDATTAKFWFHSVQISSDKMTLKSNPFKDIVDTIHAIINMDRYGPTVRTTLVASDGDIDKFLILHILEKKLLVEILEGEKRETSFMAKVLYKIVDEGAPEIKLWRETYEVDDIAISNKMMITLTNHLSAMQRYISPEFSRANGFDISYIPVPLVE